MLSSWHESFFLVIDCTVLVFRYDFCIFILASKQLCKVQPEIKDVSVINVSVLLLGVCWKFPHSSLPTWFSKNFSQNGFMLQSCVVMSGYMIIYFKTVSDANNKQNM